MTGGADELDDAVSLANGGTGRDGACPDCPARRTPSPPRRASSPPGDDDGLLPDWLTKGSDDAGAAPDGPVDELAAPWVPAERRAAVRCAQGCATPARTEPSASDPAHAAGAPDPGARLGGDGAADGQPADAESTPGPVRADGSPWPEPPARRSATAGGPGSGPSAPRSRTSAGPGRGDPWSEPPARRSRASGGPGAVPPVSGRGWAGESPAGAPDRGARLGGDGAGAPDRGARLGGDGAGAPDGGARAGRDSATAPPGEGTGTAPVPEARGPGGNAAPVPWHEAHRIAAAEGGTVEPVALPLDCAAGHTLAAPLEALTDLPPFDTSAMDGWAVSGPGPWTLTGAQGTQGASGAQAAHGVLAGRAEPEPLDDGHAVRIATGARVPHGATAVLRSERGRERDGRLHLVPGAPPHSAGHGADIRPRGQETRTGDRLLHAGAVVTPPVLGLAAAAGYDELAVTPRPRAEVLVLGDELLQRGLPRGGGVRDALGPMVGPWLAALGAQVLVTRRLGDDAEALHEAVATTTADVLVTTGGTAHGPVDHVRPMLRRVGARVLVDGVEVRPGHPMLLAVLGTGPQAGGRGGVHLVGLPGNPLAAVSAVLTLAAPLIRARAGRTEPPSVRAVLTAEVPGHPRDTRLVPVTTANPGPTPGPGTAQDPAQAPAPSAEPTAVTPLRWNGPAMLRGIAGATALAVVPPGGAPRGTSVRLLELPW